MFGPPGYAYVYRSYGIHWCLNFVCEPKGSASAVLIRAIEPTTRIPLNATTARYCRRAIAVLRTGPTLRGAGDHRHDNGAALNAPPFTLLARTTRVEVVAGPRIGITKAVDRPWRYGLKDSRFLSKPFAADATRVL